MASIARVSYSSLVEVLRYKSGTSLKGAPSFVWEIPNIVFDQDWGVPGQMLCNIDLQWVRPGSMTPPAYESGVAIPRIGTLFFDLTYTGEILLKAGDKIKTISGPVVGTFDIRVIPEPAKDIIGVVDHAEAQIVETSIVGKNLYPGTDPM